MSPKPAYEAVRRLIKEEWWTRATTQATAEGTAQVRAYFGRHRVTVTRAGGSPRSFELDLRQSGPRSFTLAL